MTDKLWRDSRDADHGPERGFVPAPGKAPVTARLPAHVARVADADVGRDDNGVAAGAEVAVERAAGSSGSALPAELQARFEGSLGADLSSVRVHTGAASAEAASAVGARAYTTGQDIHFAAGEYDPSSAFGAHLIAHEVAHTVQQQGAAPTRQHKLEVSTPQDGAELEADRAADAMVAGAAAIVSHADVAPARKLMREGNAHAPGPGAPQTPADMKPGNWKSLITPTPGPAEPNASEQIAVPATPPLPEGVAKDPRYLGGAPCDVHPQEPSAFAKPAPKYSWDVFDKRAAYWGEYTGTVNAVCGTLSNAGPAIRAFNKAEEDPTLKDVYEMQTKGKKGSVADVAGQQVVPRTSASGVTVDETFKPGTNTANTDGLDDNIKKAGKSEAVENALTKLKGEDAALEGMNSTASKAASDLAAAGHTLQAAGFAVAMDKAEDDKAEAQGEKAAIEAKAAAIKDIIGKVVTGAEFIAGAVAAGPAAAAGGVIAIAGAGGQNMQLGTYTPNEAPAPSGAQAAAGKVKSVAGNSMVSTIAGKIVDWYYQGDLDKADAKIAAATTAYKTAKKGKTTETWLAAVDSYAGQLAGLKAAMSNIKAAMMRRKSAYQELATAMATAGGGSQKDQDRMKALILAIPIAKAVVTKASNVLNVLPEAPDSTGTQIAFTMATSAGHSHQWKLVEKAGNIAGYHKQFQDHFDTWTARVTSLESIIGQVEGE